jgi:hypothetical protein
MAGEWFSAEDIPEGNVWVLSANGTVMDALLRCGWRLGGWTYWLATEPWGRFDRYHPAGGMLL